MSRCEHTPVPLYLSEADVAGLLSPRDALEAIEACFARMAAGVVENRPRYRLRLEAGALAVMAAADLGLGYAGAKVYAGFREGARFQGLLFRALDLADLSTQFRRLIIDSDLRGRLGGARLIRVAEEFAIDRAAEPLWKRFTSYGEP